MYRIFYLLAPLIVSSYLYALWSDWFTRVELETTGKRPIFSEPIDLRKAGPIEWYVPRENWNFTQGEAFLAISMNLHTLREIPASREQAELRVSVRAEGRAPGGQWEDRFLHEWSPGAESIGLGRLEYNLASVRVVSGEELRITLDVQIPDGRLMTGRPRLKLIGWHDSAGIPHQIMYLCLLREGGFWLSLGIVFWLTFLAWSRRQKSSKAD